MAHPKGDSIHDGILHTGTHKATPGNTTVLADIGQPICAISHRHPTTTMATSTDGTASTVAATVTAAYSTAGTRRGGAAATGTARCTPKGPSSTSLCTANGTKRDPNPAGVEGDS